MYVSPIELVVNSGFDTLRTELENGIVKAVQSYNVNCDKEELIKALAYDRDQYQKGFADARALVEPLTDAEQRIFLKAISREEEICKLIDEEYKDEEYTLNLVNICNEIKRKVKGALWRYDVECIKKVSSAEPEIIRCKDCKYMTEHYDTDGNAPYWACSEWDAGTDYDGFCHYAERRQE